MIAYLDGRYNEAISLLSPLQSDPAMSENERMDVLYYLGEAYWHDGQHAKGYELLRTARLRPAPNPTSPKLAFKPAIIHCAEYAVGRRLPEASAYAVSLDDPRVESVMFANRQYKDLADDRNALFHYYAMLVLDRPTTPAEDPSVPSDRHLWRAAHQAALGRFAPASAELDEVWKTFESTPNGANFYSAEILGEIVLSTTGLSDQLAKFFAFHRTWSAKHPHRYLRFAILAAPLTGDPLPPRTGMTTRERMLADAIEAELRGDRKTAADVLEQVVLDPGTFWEFPERVALLRNLIALGDQARIEKVCDEISHPAMIRAAFEPARAACRAYKNRRSR